MDKTSKSNKITSWVCKGLNDLGLVLRDEPIRSKRTKEISKKAITTYKIKNF